MKTIDEIYSELQNDEELNKAWREAKIQNENIKKIIISIFLIIDVVIVWMLLKSSINSGDTIIYMMFIVLVVNFVLGAIVFGITSMGKKQTEFNKQYKNKVINRIIKNFYDNSEYFPDKLMPEYIYLQPQYEYYNRYHSHDYFEALIDNCYSIQMAEVLAEEVKESIDDYIDRYIEGKEEKKKKEVIVKFNGLFAKIDMGKSINCELRIMQDGKLALEENRLDMDSSEFERYFDVKASNQIIAMQILTADVMEELVKFEKETKMKYDIYIRNNELYLRFHEGSLDVNIGKIKDEVLDKKVLGRYFYMINFTYNLSTKLIETINNIEI